MSDKKNDDGTARADAEKQKGNGHTKIKKGHEKVANYHTPPRSFASQPRIPRVEVEDFEID